MPNALLLAAAGRYPKAQGRRGTTHPRAVPSAVRDWLGADHQTDRRRGFPIAPATSSPPGWPYAEPRPVPRRSRWRSPRLAGPAVPGTAVPPGRTAKVAGRASSGCDESTVQAYARGYRSEPCRGSWSPAEHGTGPFCWPCAPEPHCPAACPTGWGALQEGPGPVAAPGYRLVRPWVAGHNGAHGQVGHHADAGVPAGRGPVSGVGVIFQSGALNSPGTTTSRSVLATVCLSGWPPASRSALAGPPAGEATDVLPQIVWPGSLSQVTVHREDGVTGGQHGGKRKPGQINTGWPGRRATYRAVCAGVAAGAPDGGSAGGQGGTVRRSRRP